MPLNIDLNTTPYFDDYDEAKNYHRILFRPSVAVQARELTQAQTILQNQIERFGDWAFKSGDIVQGCSIEDVPQLPYVRLSDSASNGTSNSIAYDCRVFVNAVAVSATSNLTARVLAANVGFAANYPNTNIVYLQYINTGDNGEIAFSNSELLTFRTVEAAGNTDVANVYTLANSATNSITSSNAHGVTLSTGMIYINGVFVKVETPVVGIVNAYGTDAGNSVVGFQLSETIVTENQDPSLLDNALGYSNENAPGAHRLQLIPYVVALDPTTAANTKNFNPIARYNLNSIVLKNSGNTLHSAIGEAVAQNIYDEAGNYIIKPFTVDTISKAGNSTFMYGRVSPGLGYAQGYRVELLKTAYADVRRGTDHVTVRQQQVTANYGNYVQINEAAGSFDFTTYQTVNLYDTAQQAVSSHAWSYVSPQGNVIGTARLRAFEYSNGIAGTKDATYNAYLFNIQMNSGKSFSLVKSIYFNGTSKGVGDLVKPGTLNQSTVNQMFWGFGKNALFSLKDQFGVNNSEYTYRTKTNSGTAVIDTSGNIAVDIAAVTTAAAGGSDILPYGTGQLSDSIVAADIIVVPQANATMTVTNNSVSISSTNTAVTGSGTTFTTDLSVGDSIKVGTDIRVVTAITDNTHLTVDSAFSSTTSGTYSKFLMAGRYISINSNLVGNRGVNVSSSTVMTIATGFIPASPTAVTVYFNILRTQATPASKVINKNRFVKIDTTLNPKGPWCLGVADAHALTKVYAGSSYSVTGVDLTSSFLLDSGQRDDEYSLAYLYPKSGVDLSATPKLTVLLDYFTANTTGGVGFYTVDSYPIDDVNTANTTAITTANMPLYVTGSGARVSLRDVVDFRPVATNTANNSGVVNLANTSSVTTALSYATENPSSTVTISVPVSGSHVPAVSKNFQSDYQYYLPRKDMFYFAPNGTIKIKEGAPSDAPQSPLAPDNGMAIAILSIPPYPSLTTDQMDALSGINASAYNLLRDNTKPVLVQLVANRRYTMKDIGYLDQRITNLEQYASLSLLESKATQLTITNSIGQNAFKNGIFVDPFTSHSLGDVSNPEYRIAIDTNQALARPFINRSSMQTVANAGSFTNVQKTGRALTLPYSEVVLLSQPSATEYKNVAPVAFKWNGKAQLYPSYSNNQDVNNTGSLQVTLDNGYSAWQQFAASPFGTIYGDWNTTTSQTQTVTVQVTGQAGPPINVQLNQSLFDQGDPQSPNNYFWVQIAANEQGIPLPANFAIGGFVVE